MGICMEGMCHHRKLWEDILSLVLIYLKDIFSLVFELMKNKFTHMYNVKKLNISLRSIAEIISPILVKIQ